MPLPGVAEGCPLGLRVGRVDRRAQRHCGIDSFPVILTTAAQSMTNREFVQVLVL